MANTSSSQFIYSKDSKVQGYLDASMIIVNSISELKTLNIGQSDRFTGMTVQVLNLDDSGNSHPFEVWLVDGIADYNWKIKITSEFLTYADLLTFTSGICSTLKTKKIRTNAFVKGTEVSVQNDETNNGSVSKYWIVDFDTTTGYPIWERKLYGGELVDDIESIKDKLNNKRYGNVVYLIQSDSGNSLCTWVDESGTTVWGTLEECEEKGYIPKKTYEDGMYAISQDSEGNTTFERILTDETPVVTVSGDDSEGA